MREGASSLEESSELNYVGGQATIVEILSLERPVGRVNNMTWIERICLMDQQKGEGTNGHLSFSVTSLS